MGYKNRNTCIEIQLKVIGFFENLVSYRKIRSGPLAPPRKRQKIK